MSSHTRRYYDPSVDPHLQQFFSRPAVQQHIRSQRINEAMDRAPPLYRQILERFTRETRSIGDPPTAAAGHFGGGGTTSADMCTCEGRGSCFQCYFRTRRLQILRPEESAAPYSRGGNFRPSVLEAVVAGFESLQPRPPSSRPASAGSSRGGEIVPHRQPSRPSSAKSNRSASSGVTPYTSPKYDVGVPSYGFIGKDLRGTKSWGAGPVLPIKSQRGAVATPAPPRCAKTPDRRGPPRTSDAAATHSVNSRSPAKRSGARTSHSEYEALVRQSARWSGHAAASKHVAFTDESMQEIGEFAAIDQQLSNQPSAVHKRTILAAQHVRHYTSAAKVQACFRGWRTRFLISRWKEAARRIQRAIRSRLSRHKTQRLLRLLQRTGRGFIGRRRFCGVARRLVLCRWSGTTHNELERHVIDAHSDSLLFASSLLQILGAERENRILIIRSCESAMLYYTEVELELRERGLRKLIARRAALYYRDLLKPAMARDVAHIHERGTLMNLHRESLLSYISEEATCRRHIGELYVLQSKEQRLRQDIVEEVASNSKLVGHLRQHDWVQAVNHERVATLTKPPPSPPAAPTKIPRPDDEDEYSGFDLVDDAPPPYVTRGLSTDPMPCDSHRSDAQIPDTSHHQSAIKPTPPHSDVPLNVGGRSTSLSSGDEPSPPQNHVHESRSSDEGEVAAGKAPVTIGELLFCRASISQDHDDPFVVARPQEEEPRQVEESDDEAANPMTGQQQTVPHPPPTARISFKDSITALYPPIHEESSSIPSLPDEPLPVARAAQMQAFPFTQPPENPVAGDTYVDEQGNLYYYEEVEETDEEYEEGEGEEMEESIKISPGTHVGHLHTNNPMDHESDDDESIPML